MNETAAIIASLNEDGRDATTNRAIRDVATTPSPQHVIPAEVVAFLYEHVDLMRAEFFAGQVPEVVLSFEVTDRRTLGHYHLARTGMGVRWALNLNPIHLARPVFEVLATLLHELAHAWQHEHGTPSKPPHHNRELRERCAGFGVPTDEGGHDLGVRHGTPFEYYCRRHGIGFPPLPGSPEPGAGEPGQPGLSPLVPVPPARPKGSKMKKYTCPCGVNVRVAIADFQAVCCKCGGQFERSDR